MGYKVSVQSAVTFARKGVCPAFSWPLPFAATEFQKFKFTVLWHLTFLNVSCLFFPLLYSIYEYRDNLFIVTTSTCYVAACGAALVKYCIFKIHREKIQSLTREMEKFLKIATTPEQKILESYAKRCSGFHCAAITVNYLAGIFVICGPLFLPNQKLPASAVYPFPVDSGLVHYFVYLFQIIATIQISAGANIDGQIALLTWFVSSRFEMLAGELQTLRGPSDLRRIVKMHQHLIRLSKEATEIMSHIAFTTAASGCIVVLSSCLILVDNQSLVVKMQFGPMALISSAGLFVCAWPSDNLINTCNLVGHAAYNSPWIDMSPKMRKNMLIIIHRAQQPIVVSVGGFIPTLSLRYYGRYVSAAISYLMTLRIVIGSDHF